MNTKATIGAATLLLIGMMTPATAFHIVGNADGTDPTLTSEDWRIPNMVLTLCESDGPNDPLNDQPLAKAGDGGLCYMDYPGASNTTAPSATAITEYDMTRDNGQDFTWFFSGGDAACAVGLGETVRMNDLYSFWQTGPDQTHASGFPDVGPAFPNGVGVGDDGSYSASVVTAHHASACDEAHLPVTVGTP